MGCDNVAVHAGVHRGLVVFVVGRLRVRLGHRVSGRQAAGVRQLAGETGQAERGRRHRDHREEASGWSRRRPVKVNAAEQR